MIIIILMRENRQVWLLNPLRVHPKLGMGFNFDHDDEGVHRLFIMSPLWPELSPPPELESCTRCELARQSLRRIWGEGTPQGRFLIVLDNPGSREDKDGLPFVCGTRQTLQLALEQAGIAEKDVCLTYLLKCRPRRKYNHLEACQACLPFLEGQIHAENVMMMVCMGNVVVQTLFGAWNDVKSTRGKRLNYRGIPVITTYHPLAARRHPNLFKPIVSDLQIAADCLMSPNEPPDC